MLVLYFLFCIGVISAYKNPSQCAVYCQGDVLSTIQEANLYVDSKTFVDMPMKYDPEEVLSAFQMLPNHTVPVLSKFLRDYFLPSGSEIMSWTPTDWKADPHFINNIENSDYRVFASQLNTMWTALGKQLIPDVHQNPQRYSIIPQNNPFMVPGERFHEFYYWDSYWIIKGLLTCGMNETARGIILNAFDLVREYGFVPNGARVYYLTRSQPPLLSEMVRYYYEQTKDKELLTQAVAILEKEYNFWMTTHAVELPGGHTLNRYFSDNQLPRPESYREDVTTAQNMSQEQAKKFYANIVAGAESGEDFSSRWFSFGNELNSIETTSIVPVDLNSILYKFEANMLYFYDTIGTKPTFNYTNAMQQRKTATDLFLWNNTTVQWHDYCIDNSSQIIRSYPTNWLPIWANAYDAHLTNDLLLSIKNSNLIQTGGVLSTLVSSGQQWDSPNAWAPHQSFMVDILLQLGSPESTSLAEKVAHQWIEATYIGYQNSKMMHEKYNAFIPGDPGSGGEYPPQIGFGWTNGVTIDFLSQFG